MIDPFKIGPVLPDGFLGRAAELADVLACIDNAGDSLVIVSELPNGRTSLLQRLEALLRAQGRRVTLVEALRLPQDITPADFWHKLGAKLDIDLSRSYGGRFAGPVPVLLLDDFHEVLRRPLLRVPEFLGMLRSFANIRLLKFVSSSARDLVTLDDSLGHAWGSPFLNAYREQRLGPLGSRDVEHVLGLAGDELGPLDRAFVARCAGGQPRLLNLLASGHLRVNRAAPPGTRAADRRRSTLHGLRNELGYHLRDFWARLTSDERWALLNVCVAQTCRTAIAGDESLEAGLADPDSGRPSSAAIVRFFQGLPRATLKLAVQQVLGVDAVHELPSDLQPDAVFAAETESYLRRRLRVGDVLASLRGLGVPAGALRALAHAGPRRPSSAAMANALERLTDIGLLLPSRWPPGWEIRPAVLTGWLRDHLRAPDLLERLFITGVDTYLLAPLQSLVLAHRASFAGGAADYFEGLYDDSAS